MLGKAEEYLLHREPMLLLDDLLECSENQVKTQVVIGEKHRLFMVDEKIPSWISIELMAQTVGMWAGYQAKLQRGEEPKIGFLLGGRQCHCEAEHYRLGECLTVNATILMQDERMASFQAEIINDKQQVVAKGRLTTYQPDDSELNSLLGK